MTALVLFCAMLLAGAALHKLLARERLAIAAARLAGTRPPIGPLLLVIAGTMEVFAAVCLMVEPLRLVGALAAGALWAGYALLLWRRRSETLDCGCDLVGRTGPVTTAHALRPAALSLLALLLAVPSSAPFTLDAPFAAAGLLALYLAASELLALPKPAWRTA